MANRDELRQQAQLIQTQQFLSANKERRITKNIKATDNVIVGERTYGNKVKIEFPDGSTANAGLLFNASYSQGAVYPAVQRSDGQWYLLNRSHQPTRSVDDDELIEEIGKIRWLLVTRRVSENVLVLRIGGNTEEPTEVLTLPFTANDTYSARYPATVAQGVRCYFAFKLDLTSEEEEGWVISYGMITGISLSNTTPWQNNITTALYKVTASSNQIIFQETIQTIEDQQLVQYYPVGYGNWIKSAVTITKSGSGDSFIKTETHVDTMYFDSNQSTSTWTYTLYKSDPAQQYYKYGGNQLVKPSETRSNSYYGKRGQSYSYEPPLISQNAEIAIGPHIRYQPYIPSTPGNPGRQADFKDDAGSDYPFRWEGTLGNNNQYFDFRFGGYHKWINTDPSLPYPMDSPLRENEFEFSNGFTSSALTTGTSRGLIRGPITSIEIRRETWPTVGYDVIYINGSRIVAISPFGILANTDIQSISTSILDVIMYPAASGGGIATNPEPFSPESGQPPLSLPLGAYSPTNPYGPTGEERRSYITSNLGDKFSVATTSPDNHYFYRDNHSLYSSGSYSINNAALTDLFGENAGSTISCSINRLNPDGGWNNNISPEDCFTFPIPDGETHIIAYDRQKVQVSYYPD